jgi:hypothetical protein
MQHKRVTMSSDTNAPSFANMRQEQLPIPKHQLHGWTHYVGLYAAEHVAATEFVIGATFVGLGASTMDIVVGFLWSLRTLVVCHVHQWRDGNAAFAGIVGIGADKPYGLGDFLQIGNHTIWTGVNSNGKPGIDLLEVIGFAWAANTIVHFGFIDMAILRYAKRKIYGLCTSSGMLFGH